MNLKADAEMSLPADALDPSGKLLSPRDIPIEALLEPEEMLRFAQALAALAQSECSLILYNPEKPSPVAEGSPIQFVNAPICLALNKLMKKGGRRCEWDVHAAAHKAMDAGEPVNADCVGGKSLLMACPIMLEAGGATYPKAAIVAAVNDIFCFDFADKLARRLQMPVEKAQDIMCQTDKRYLNAEQLRRLRSIMEGYARAFSRQAAERYAELQSISTVLGQKQELQRAYGRLDYECAMVGLIQRSLVPHENPSIKGYAVETYYSPATRAGGDYFDFLPLPDGSCGVFMADVSGHGPGAAVIMAMLRALVHAYPGDLRESEALLEYTNRHLYENALNDQFATAYYSVIEPHGHAHIASAGHNPPLFYRADTGDVFEAQIDTGLPLAVVRDAHYSSVCVMMCQGDVLLLYTDGFSEMMDPSGATFGIERLVDIMRRFAPRGGRAVRDAVLRETEAFAAGRPPEDDRALVALQKL